MNPLASFELDYNSGLPVWIQVKNRIAYLIGSGEYKAGDQLPTVRSLAVDLDISYNTVNRAYMDLEREGYISTRKGRGTRAGRALYPLGREPLLVDEETCVAAIRDARDMRPVRCSARASARLCRAKREGGGRPRSALYDVSRFVPPSLSTLSSRKVSQCRFRPGTDVSRETSVPYHLINP